MDPTHLDHRRGEPRDRRPASLSPVALTEAYLDRIAALDGELHSYVLVLHEAGARAAARELAAGRSRGALHGIPIGLKDIYKTTRHPHDRRLAALSRPCAGRGCRDLGAAARRRRDPARQAGDARIRDRRAGFHPALPAGAQPVEHGALPGRLVERLGGRGRAPVCAPARWARTPAARSAARRPIAASSG